MIGWDLLKRVYGFVGDLPNEDKMKEITLFLEPKKTYSALKRYVSKEPLEDIAKLIGMVLPSSDSENFFLDNLRYYDYVSSREEIPIERILSNPEISLSLEIYSDFVLRNYYKGEYKSRKELLQLCAEEISKKGKCCLPYSQMSLYADKRVIRIWNGSENIYYKVRELYTQLLRNPNFLSKETKELLLRAIGDKFIQWGVAEPSLQDLQKILSS